MYQCLLRTVWLMGLVMLLTLPLGIQAVTPTPSPHYIMTAGESQSSHAVKEQAIQDAERKAVTQALARLITPDSHPDSIFQQISRQYASYLTGKSKIVRVQKNQGKTIVFCKVPVNFPKLQEQLKTRITTLQQSDAHIDDEAYFFVRITGLTNKEEQQMSQAEVLNFYTDAFQQYGFQKGMADDLLVQSIEQYATYPQNAYLRAIEHDIQQDMAISLAIVGEIHLAPSQTDATGTNSTCQSQITVYNHKADGTLVPIGTFSDTYTLRRANKQEAESLVLQKAAYNSAKYLSHLTLTYWKNQLTKGAIIS